MVFFYIGWRGFLNYDTPASNAVTVEVEAHKWAFQFTYPNGGISDTLYVEKGKPVKLLMHSIDVLHALYIPAFRTQRNLIPFRQTEIWFVPEALSPPDGFPIFCTQYCGQGHSTMHTTVHVLSHADFEKQMGAVANPFKTKLPDGTERWVPYVQLGQKFYTQMGCSTCHTIDGTKGTGPTWKGLWKSNVEFSASDVPNYALAPTDSDQKWSDYIHQSVIHPEAKIVASFPNVMPSFASQFEGAPGSPKDEKIRAIITYIESIGNTGWKPPYPTDSDVYDVSKHPNHHPESLAVENPAATQAK
jgi:cytochrome c oxidase subunit 2